MVCIWESYEKFRNLELLCFPDEYEQCLMHKPLDSMYPKIYTNGTYESRINNKITIYDVDDNNQIKTSKYHEIKMQDDLEANKFKVRIGKWNALNIFPIGLVTEVLNCKTTIDDGIRCLKLQYHINDTEVSDELFHESRDSWFGRRLDFSDILTFTIDPVDSHDFDDALSFERIVHENQTYYKIGIHIADVAKYVKKTRKLILWLKSEQLPVTKPLMMIINIFLCYQEFWQPHIKKCISKKTILLHTLIRLGLKLFSSPRKFLI